MKGKQCLAPWPQQRTILRACDNTTRSPRPPIHPAWRCCSSVAYPQVCALLAPCQAGASTTSVGQFVLSQALILLDRISPMASNLDLGRSARRRARVDGPSAEGTFTELCKQHLLQMASHQRQGPPYCAPGEKAPDEGRGRRARLRIVPCGGETQARYVLRTGRARPPA